MHYLGIEIGGTKLQLAVGAGDGSPPAAQQRLEVDPRQGAQGILQQIRQAGTALLQRHPAERVGIGFGGPIDTTTGRVSKSHQIAGWEDVPLVDWCQSNLGLPAVLGNDCNVAALAEARFGAGREARRVFYVTVGTGVGGGLVIDSQIYGTDRPSVAEIGHMRPGLHADRPEATVESLASGWGISAAARARFTDDVSRRLQSVRREGEPLDPAMVRQRLADAEQADEEYLSDLLHRCQSDLDLLTTKMIAQAAAEGNEVARDMLDHAIAVLGWAIAQVITLVAPEVVVVGGGVSLIGEQLFFTPLRKQVNQYVFPPLTDSYQIAPAQLGDLAVVHGALALAAEG